jgi:hypothetical protein
MNWYFEDNGVAQGPYPEAEVELKIRLNNIAADTLLWHTGLVEWQTVEKLRPQWLKPSAPVPVTAKADPKEPATLAQQSNSKSKARTEQPEEAKPTLRPTAPLKTPDTAEEGKKGILKRIFGIGKKSG